MKLEFSRQIFGKPQITNFMKISPMGDGLFHLDRRKDERTEGQT